MTNQINERLDKIILLLIIIFPFSLVFSILIAEILSGVIVLIALIYLFNRKYFKKKINPLIKPISVILILYLFILISLVFSNNISKSFLPSFFYFRYLILSLTFYYVITQFQNSLKFIFYSYTILLSLILVDSLIEYLQIYQVYDFKTIEQELLDRKPKFISSFFNDEKKLGSFLIRFLPFYLCLLIYLDKLFFKKIYFEIIIICLTGVLIVNTTERVALFLYFMFLFFYFIIIKNKKIIFLPIIFIIFSFIFDQNDYLKNRYFYGTLKQFNIVNSHYKADNIKYNFTDITYLSDEHEKLIRSGIEIFKENYLTGSGIKTYHQTCNKIKKQKSLDIECSTHPHNTFIQIFSDIGIFGGLIVIGIFLYILSLVVKTFFIKNISTNIKCFYMLNVGIILNLMPFIPSGSIFNNWLSYMIFYPVGLWFYFYYLIIKQK